MTSIPILRRLKSEYDEMNKNPPENCSAGPIDDSDMARWKGTIIGPIGTPYEGGIFDLSIVFPVNYPFKPPKITFITKVYHPNINENGEICLDILKDKWSPALKITGVLLSICSLFSDPNPDDPLNSEVAHIYKTNRNQYELNARKFTHKYAGGGMGNYVDEEDYNKLSSSSNSDSD